MPLEHGAAHIGNVAAGLALSAPMGEMPSPILWALAIVAFGVLLIACVLILLRRQGSDLISWDVAAGALIVREAGGHISDFSGGDGWWDSGDIVASNGRIHPALLEAAATPNGIADLEAAS